MKIKEVMSLSLEEVSILFAYRKEKIGLSFTKLKCMEMGIKWLYLNNFGMYTWSIMIGKLLVYLAMELAHTESIFLAPQETK